MNKNRLIIYPGSVTINAITTYQTTLLLRSKQIKYRRPPVFPSSMNAKSFWLRVNQLLKKKKITQKELADFIGTPQRTLQNWIFRGIFPLVTEGYLMAKFLNVSVDFLVTGREDKNQAKITAIRSLLTRADEKLGKLY